jgi:hypothetical protein
MEEAWMQRHTASRSLAAVVAALLLLGCGDGLAEDGPPPGYLRFQPEPIEVAPGESPLWMHWVGDPADHDRDVLDLIASQGPGGHHAVLYSTAAIEPVGTSREWRQSDQLLSRFLGGTGGKGAAGELGLPEDLAFRVPAGHALVVQVHYLNAGDEPLLGETQIDVKLAEASPEQRVASMFAQTSLGIQVSPGDSSLDVSCTLERDLELVMWANHMHQHGRSASTVAISPAGATLVLKEDPVWDPEWTYNPIFERRPSDEPLVLEAGTRVETTCRWHNQSGETVRFPEEMCLFFGFYIGQPDLTCVGGRFVD